MSFWLLRRPHYFLVKMHLKDENAVNLKHQLNISKTNTHQEHSRRHELKVLRSD